MSSQPRTERLELTRDEVDVVHRCLVDFGHSCEMALTVLYGTDPDLDALDPPDDPVRRNRWQELDNLRADLLIAARVRRRLDIMGAPG